MVSMKGAALILICAFASTSALALNIEEEEIELNGAGCPLNYTIFKVIEHEKYCNLFYTCDRGSKVEQQCPIGLVFNNKSNVCDWKLNVDCGKKEIYDLVPESEEKDEEATNPGGNNDPSLAPEICALENSTGVLVAHENCTQFYECDNGVPTPLYCPNGLFYNSEVGYCDWPSNVDCGNRTIPESIIDPDLPEIYLACASDDKNLILLAHETCNRFYKCSFGLPVVFSCPRGLVYNTENNTCDWQANVDCGNRPIVEDDTEEVTEEVDEDDHTEESLHGHSDASQAPAICAEPKSDSILISHENCSQFYQCWKGLPVTMDCPLGLYYNPEQGYCDWPQNVDCGTRSKSS